MSTQDWSALKSIQYLNDEMYIIVEKVTSGELSADEACRHYHLTRKEYDAWVNQYYTPFLGKAVIPPSILNSLILNTDKIFLGMASFAAELATVVLLGLVLTVGAPGQVVKCRQVGSQTFFSYSFTVDGRTYASTSRLFFNGSDQDLQKQYPEGKQITVQRSLIMPWRALLRLPEKRILFFCLAISILADLMARRISRSTPWQEPEEEAGAPSLEPRPKKT